MSELVEMALTIRRSALTHQWAAFQTAFRPSLSGLNVARRALCVVAQHLDRPSLPGVEGAPVIGAPDAGSERQINAPYHLFLGRLGRFARFEGRIIPWSGLVITAALIGQAC